MATIAVTSVGALVGSSRIDAEIYQPSNSSARTAIANLATRKVALGRVSAFVRKGIFDIKAATYVSDGVPFVRVSNIRHGLIDRRGLEYLPPELHAQHVNTALIRGDLVLSKTARVAASLVDMDECNVSQDVIAIRISEEWRNTIRPAYVVAYLNTDVGHQLLGQWLQGNVQMHLALPDIRRLQVPIADGTVQTRAEEAWDRAASDYENARSLMLDADRRLSAVFGLDAWDPPTAKSYTGHLSELGAALRFDAEHHDPRYAALDELIDSHPNGSTRLTSVVPLSTATVRPREAPNDEFRYIELSAIHELLGLVEDYETMLGSAAPGRARMTLKTDDIVASSVEGSFAKVGLVPEHLSDSVGSTGFNIFRPRGHAGFALLLIRNSLVRMQFHRWTSGSILAAVPSESLVNIRVPTTPAAVVAQLDEQVRQAHALYWAAQGRLREAVLEVTEALWPRADAA